MHRSSNKKRVLTKLEPPKGSRSYSQPAFPKLTPLPPVAYSDIRKSRAKTDPPGTSHSMLEPWHSTRIVKHLYVPSLESLEVTDGYRRLKKGDELSTVKISGPDLSKPPERIFQMTELESLVLSPDKESCIKFKLGAVPKEVANLRNLRQLILDTNGLQEIPEQLSELAHLDTLTLSNNHLATLPEGFSNLSNLQSLHLANNRFTEIPLEVCFLENLSFLDMSDNSIREVPEEIEELSLTLTMLFLYINDLQQLPDSFCYLTELTTLWLGKNQLKSLPEEFGDLVNLDWADYPSESNIDDNPLSNPPVEICRKGADAIQKYFSKARKKRG